jgi:short-subunit dehydrogenase
MSAPLKLAARWVLVTGASSGLGLEMARQLARDHRANLVLVARRRDRLEALKGELESRHGVQVAVVVADLAREEDVARVFHEATSGRSLAALILNAGVTHFGEHTDLSWAEFKQMLDTNVNAVAHLTHLAVPYLLARKQPSGVMLVASLAGVSPLPYQAAYSGTKSFLVGFGHSLWHELRHTDVSITTFIPGGIATEMADNTGLTAYFGSGGLFMQSAEACAKEALDALVQRKHTHVPGAVNQLSALFTKLLPRSFTVGQVASQYRKALALKQASSAGKAR